MFTKYASLESAQVLGVRGSNSRVKTASLDKFSEFDKFRTEDGYLYARIRAISSRVNKNNDGWPSVELAGGQDIFNRIAGQRTAFTVEADSDHSHGYSTFLGKPIFVDHHNSDPERARGVIVDAKLHVEDHKTAAEHDPYYSSAPENHTPPTWVELLLEVDAKSFPRLAKAIIEGSRDANKGIDGFSMGCFVAGTPITLADGSRTPIESINVGDEILTHSGKTEPVTYTMKRPHRGLVYDVRTYGQAHPLVMTEEHPVWTKKGWVEAKDLQVGDHVLTPMIEGVGHSGTYAFARLLGYYLAEGNLGRDLKRFADGSPTSVEWNFHVDEVEYISEVQTLLKALGYSSAGPYIKNNCASIRCNSPELSQRFLDYGGQHSWGKRLHPEVLRWEPDNQKGLLNAYFDGDGCYRGDSEKRRVEAGTASETLAAQLQLLATRVGYRMTPPVKQHSPSAAHKRAKYNMQATLVEPDTRTTQNAHLDESGLWRRITAIATKEHDGPVYNFDVEGDDSYVASDVAVHNCDVEKSVCNICKNAATSPDEYCEHVRLKGASFDVIDEKTGHKTSRKSYEDCYGIKFFEISAVFDPADETALTRELIQEEDRDRGGHSPSFFSSLGRELEKTAPGPFDQENPDFRGQELAVRDYLSDPGLIEQNMLSEVERDALNQLEQKVQSGEVHPGTSLGDLTPEQLAEELGLVQNPVPEFELPERQPGPEETKAQDLLDLGKIPTVSPDHPQYNAKTATMVRTYKLLREANAPIPPDLVSELQKVAENPLPQSDLLHKPEDLDTLRNETVCPVCGSAMDDETCDICGYVEPPEGFKNPDLEKAQQEDLEDPLGEPEELDPELESPQDQPNVAQPDLLEGRNPGMTASVRNEMPNKWNISINPRVAARINVQEKPITTSTGPQTNEPNEKVVQDETKPVTSSVRTAKDFIEAARHNQEKKMSKTAAEPVPAASPDKRVDVEGVGGVADASNEQASKADAQVEVDAKGGTGVEDVSADQEGTNVDQGDEHSKNIEGTKTDTWSGQKGQTSPVGGDTFPSESGQGAGRWSAQRVAYDNESFPKEDGGLSGGGANQGTQPVDPVGKADDRIDVLKPVTSPENNSGPTDTWSGTDGNSVTRQQDPVTNETLEKEDIVNLSPPKSSSHIFSAVKLADLEVEVGLTAPEEKWDRMTEIESQSPEVVQASLDYVERIKTKVAAIQQKSQVKQARRLPSFGGGTLPKQASSSSNNGRVSDQELDDSSLFLG